KTSIFSHPVYLFLRKFSLQDSRGGSGYGVPGEAGQPFLVAFVEPFVAGLILLFHFHIPHGDITGSRMPPAGRRLRLLRVNG
ncbi:hypothetical protein AAAY92_22490, partial [Escherichia coli]